MLRATIVDHSKGSLFISICRGLREHVKAVLQELEIAVNIQLSTCYITGASSDTDKKLTVFRSS